MQVRVEAVGGFGVAEVVGRRDEENGRVEIKTALPSTIKVLAARFDNLKEGAPAKVVAQRSAPTASNPASSASKS